MAGRLVDVEIDRDHEFELPQRPREPPAVRHRQDRIACINNQRPHLTGTFCLDLLG